MKLENPGHANTTIRHEPPPDQNMQRRSQTDRLLKTTIRGWGIETMMMVMMMVMIMTVRYDMIWLAMVNR